MNKQTAKLLEKHFDIALETKDGVKKLRELILTLAMKGKLVEQDERDGTAGELLREIEGEKRRLVKEGKIRKIEVMPEILPDEISYSIPASWKFVRMADIAWLITDGTHLTPKYTDNGRIFLSAQNVKPFRFLPEVCRYVSEEDYQGYIKSRKAEINDVLITRVGSNIGEAAKINQNIDFAFYVSLGLIKFFPKFTDSDYIVAWLNSPDGSQKSLENTLGKGVSQSNLNLSLIRKFVLPLPPLPEQHRIVAKINQLMSLCDKLEAQRNERSNKRLKIHTAAINGLLSAPDKSGFNTSWHFITKNFSELYSVPENVEELKKAILQLAVMGKLTQGESRPVILGDVIELISGQHLLANEQNESKKGIPYLTGPSDFGAVFPTASRWTEKPKVVAEPGDILLTVKGAGVGKTNKLLLEKTAISRQLMAVRVIGADSGFIHLVLQNAASYFQATMTGIAIPGIGRKDVLNLKFRLPAPIEQHRIVAKIDQLMTLCNTLVQQVNNSTDKQTAILDAVLAKI